MKLLLDQGLPRSTVRHLASIGIGAEHVGDLGMAQAADADILEVARERRAAVVTSDADFQALLATSHATSPSVVRIRIQGLKGEELASLLGQILALAAAEIELGAVVSVTAGRMRVHLLPIGG